MPNTKDACAACGAEHRPGCVVQTAHRLGFQFSAPPKLDDPLMFVTQREAIQHLRAENAGLREKLRLAAEAYDRVEAEKEALSTQLRNYLTFERAWPDPNPPVRHFLADIADTLAQQLTTRQLTCGHGLKLSPSRPGKACYVCFRQLLAEHLANPPRG